MTLEEYAAECGMISERCDPSLGGGPHAFRNSADSGAWHCGYRTRRAACLAWLRMRLGDNGAKVTLKLLKRK